MVICNSELKEVLMDLSLGVWKGFFFLIQKLS